MIFITSTRLFALGCLNIWKFSVLRIPGILAVNILAVSFTFGRWEFIPFCSSFPPFL